MYIGLHVKYRYCRQILMKLEFSWQISEKYSNTKFHQNSCSGSRDVPCRRTDRHDKANSRFSHICERTWKCKSIVRFLTTDCVAESFISLLQPKRTFLLCRDFSKFQIRCHGYHRCDAFKKHLLTINLVHSTYENLSRVLRTQLSDTVQKFCT